MSNFLEKVFLKGASFDEYNSHLNDLASLYKKYSKYSDTFYGLDSKLNLLEKALMLTESLYQKTCLWN